MNAEITGNTDSNFMGAPDITKLAAITSSEKSRRALNATLALNAPRSL